MDTDASDTGIGCTLSQIQWCKKSGQPEEKPIAFASKSLTKSQRKYCVTRRELLALVTFVQQFRHYLLGRHFVVRTDHSALRWIMSFKEPHDQMARWLEVLSQFDFKVQHREGRRHGNADSLSRIPCDPDDCRCYDGQTIIQDLPCGGCQVCLKRHEEWSSFITEVDDVVPLSARCVQPTPEKASGWKARLMVMTLMILSFLMVAGHGFAATTKDFCWRASSSVGVSVPWTLPRWKTTWQSLGGGCAKPVMHVRSIGMEPCNHDDDTDVGSTWAGGYTKAQLVALQEADADLGKVMAWMEESGHRPPRDRVAAESPVTRHLWLLWDQLQLTGGVLYKRQESTAKTNEVLQLVVPRCLQNEIMEHMHNSTISGHLGVKKTVSRLQRHFYWHRLRDSVSTWIHKCAKCGARKRPICMPKAPLGDYRVGAPMDRVATDILGPLPLTERGNRYVLVIVDCFSRYTEAYAIPDFTAKTTADVIVTQFFSRFGVPLELHSDQGRNYESQLFAETCKLLGIHKTRSSPYHPSSNGMVERFNSTLLNMVSVFVQANQKDWDQNLELLTAAYRSSKHEGTGFSPNLLFMGREVNLPIDLLLGVPLNDEHLAASECDYVADLRERMTAVFETARENLQRNSERQKRDYDVRLSVNNFQQGDLVYMLDSTKVVGQSPKLKANVWQGPCLILRKISDLLFELKPGQKKRAKILHHDRLKPYVSDDIPEWIKKLQAKIKTGPEDTPPCPPEASVLPSSVTTPAQGTDRLAPLTDTSPGQSNHSKQGNGDSLHAQEKPTVPTATKHGSVDKHAKESRRHSSRNRRQPDRYAPQ